MPPPSTGQVGETHQPGLTSGDLRTCLLDDPGHHHEMRLQPPGKRPDGQVNDSSSRSGSCSHQLGSTYLRGIRAEWMFLSINSNVLQRDMYHCQIPPRPSLLQSQVPDSCTGRRLDPQDTCKGLQDEGLQDDEAETTMPQCCLPPLIEESPTQSPTPSPGQKVKIAQLCPTLCNLMNYIAHGILQARILEWVAFPFSRGSSQTRG